MAADAADPRRFDIALSFPGEHRDYVKEVAAHLASTFSEDRVLYDHFHDAEFARLDLNTYLPGLYRKDSELIVIFLCPEYAAKLWCRLEWRHISQLIATVDAQRIMFLSFGNPGDLSELGILGGDGYINVLPLAPQVAAEKILKRLSLNKGTTAPLIRPVPVPVPVPALALALALALAPASLVRADISRIDKYAPAELIGREAETELLSDAWDKAVRGDSNRPRVLTFVALGGEGKTSLVAKWAADLAHQGWTGCDAVFAWSFYSQGTREQTAASSDLFLADALTFFGDPEMAQSSQSAFDKGRRLAQLIGARRVLLILDGVEPLQYAPTSPTPGELKDSGLAALLKGLAANNHGLCVVTTRYSIPDLKAYRQTTAPETMLLRLSNDAGVSLLKLLGVNGVQSEYETLVEDVKGHALTLNLLGSYLVEAHAGDIRKRDLVKLKDAAEEQGGHAFRVMDAYVNWFETGGKKDEENKKGKRALAVLRLLGLFDRPASADCLAALLKAPAIPGLTELLLEITEAQRNITVTRLEAAKLITVTRAANDPLPALDSHPLLREYFAHQLRTHYQGAWQAAHSRLFEHLCNNMQESDAPTLEELQPLYQAVVHGCQAGRQQEACGMVFLGGIRRGKEDYSQRKLGAFSSDLGAIACFFDQPWSRLSSSFTRSQRGRILNDAGYALRALGRLREALEPLRAAMTISSDMRNWESAALSTGNLGELNLTLGAVSTAVSEARQSMVYAERSGIGYIRMITRTAHADALHQSGCRAEALKTFKDAEALQCEIEPAHPWLYSRRGFQYCDLLLAAPERAAWQYTIGKVNSPFAIPPETHVEAIVGTTRGIQVNGTGSSPQDAPTHTFQSCRDVSQRAAQTLSWTESAQMDIHSSALDHLTLARVMLFEGIFMGTPLAYCQAAVQRAMDGLRRAGQQQSIPLALFTQAWLRSLSGEKIGPESAQSDLDEAWEIAERGPMPLFLADIHLHRARLFGPHASGTIGEPYPWKSPAVDLAAARHLIEKHGYWRRKEELEDAEAAAKTW